MTLFPKEKNPYTVKDILIYLTILTIIIGIIYLHSWIKDYIRNTVARKSEEK